MRFVLALLAALGLAGAAFAGPIPAYPPATQPLTGAEQVVGVQNTRTVQIPVGTIASLAIANPVSSRAAIPTLILPATAIQVGGYRTPGDLGAGAIYTTTGCTSGGIQAIQDAVGHYFCLVVNGYAIPGQFGAYCDYNPTLQTGHDDTAAFTAAVATKVAVLVGRPASSTGGLIACGVTGTIVVNNGAQNWTQDGTVITAMAGFSGPYVLTFGGGSQVITNANADAGGLIGVVTSGIHAHGVDNIYYNPFAGHYLGTYGINVDGQVIMYHANAAQWQSTDPQFTNNANFTAIGLEVNVADSLFIDTIPHWNKTNIYLDCGSGTEIFTASHPFNGGDSQVLRIDPENIHVAGCSMGNIHFDGMYNDDGQSNIYGKEVSFNSDNWPLSFFTLENYTNPSIINYYPNGSSSIPNYAHINIVATQGGVDPNFQYFSILNNPNTLAITGATASAGTVTVSVAGWTNDMPQPKAGGQITIAGNSIYNGTWAVTGATSTSVKFTSVLTGSGTGGTVQFTWAGDYTGVSALEPASSDYDLHTVAQKYIAVDSSQPGLAVNCLVSCTLFNGSVGGSSGQFNINMDATGNMTFQTLSIGRMLIAASGVVRPITDGGSAPNATFGIASVRWPFVYDYVHNDKPQTLSALEAFDNAPSNGDKGYITDATSCTFLGAITGGGSVNCPVHYNGAAWVGG